MVNVAKTRVEGNEIPQHGKEMNEMKQILKQGPAGDEQQGLVNVSVEGC